MLHLVQVSIPEVFTKLEEFFPQSEHLVKISKIFTKEQNLPFIGIDHVFCQSSLRERLAHFFPLGDFRD